MSTVFINEFHYDNVGTDIGEFVEIVGHAGVDLSSYGLYFYNGSNGSAYNSFALSGTLTDDTGTGWGFSAVTLPTNGLQNGSPDGIALVDIDTSTVLEFISYEGSFTAVDGLAWGLTSTDIGVFEPSITPFGTSLQLQGTGTSASDFTWAGGGLTETSGAANVDQIFGDYLPATVPLPAALPLLLVGLVALTALRRRRA